jgi:hypothetical protein
MNSQYCIVRLNETMDEWEVLNTYNSYKDADRKLDYYAELYLNSVVDILPKTHLY